MKTYKKLNKFKAILLLSIFVGSIVYFVPENPLSDVVQEKQEPALYSTWGLGTTHNTADLKDSSPPPTATKQSIDYTQWYLSESVLTDIEFNPQIMDYGSIVDEITGTYPYTFFSSGSFNTFSDDELEHDLTWVFDSPDTTYHAFASFKLYCGGTGTLSYEVFGRGTSSAPTSITTPEETSSDTIYSSWLDNQGYSHMIFIIYGTTTSISLELNVIIPATGVFLELFDISNTGSITDVEELLISMDVLSFTRNIISNNIRSEIRYTTSMTQSIHRVIIPSVPHAKEIRVYTDLDFSSINPAATVTRVSDYWKIASPVEISYEMLFNSKTNNLLAITEVTSDFLTDVGFETAQYLNDWTVNYGTFDLYTQTIFDGSYSLSIETSNNDYFTTSYGDACDFEEDVDEFDIKLNGLPTLDTIFVADEYKLRLYTGLDGSDYGARRDNLNIDTNQYTLFSTEITMNAGVKADRVKITLHFDDASTQDHIEPIASGTTEEFDFDITADKTIEMIDIYYGDASWDIGGGDRIYVSYVKILETGAELTLTLPEDDYYLSYSTYLETGSMTLTTDDQTLVNDGSITDRWINNFVFTHTDTITFTILFDNLDLTNFLDNFRIFQTSTTITTQGYSEYYFSSTLTAWDGYKNPFMPFADFEFELWDRTAQTLEDSYSTTTNEYGIATWTLERGLELKEYTIKTFNLDSHFILDNSTYYYDQATEDQDLGDWGNVNIVGTFIESFDSDAMYGDVSYKVIMDDANNDGGFQYVSDYSIELNDYDKLCFWMKSTVAHSGTGDMYVWGPLGYTQGGLTVANVLAFYTDWTFYSVDLRDYFTISNQSIFDGAMYFRFDVDYEPAITVYMDDLHFQHAVKLYFTPSVPSQTDYAETELLDAWDWTEGDFDIPMQTYATVNETVENGYYFAQADTATYNSILLYDSALSVSIDCSYYTHLLFRAKMDDWIDGGNRWEFNINTGGTPYDTEFYYTDYIYPTDSEYGEWVTWLVDLRTTTNFEAGYQWGVDIITLDTIAVYHTGGQAHEMTEDLWIDYIAFVHIDSFLEETNDYATDELLDAWDFEEYDSGTVLDGWQESVGGQTIELEDGCFKVDITSVDAYTRLVAPGLSISASTYTQIIITIKTNEDDLQIYFAESGNQGITAKTVIGVANVFHTLVFDIDDTDWSGTETALYLWLYDSSGSFEADEFFWIEEIRLQHPEEMPYTIIQNSVLLESETNDLQYNLYLDHNFIGTFPDLSLIPLVSTVGTHYFQVQPFRTDDIYCTQNVYSYYYTVEAASFSVSVSSFYLSDNYVNTYVTSNYDFDYYVYEDDDPAGSGSGYKEGTAISSNRDATEGVTIAYAIKFVYDSEIVWFNTSYSNSRSAFYVEEYKIDKGDENIQIIWSTTKSDIDSLTVYEGTVLKVDADTTSPSSWTKSTTIGVHYVTLIFEAVTYGSIIYSFNYEIVAEVFEVNVESFHLSEDYINTYITASENGNYQVFENNTAITSPAAFYWAGTSIQTDRNTTEGAFLNYAIKFYNAEVDIIWFNTTYSNTLGDFFVNDYSVSLGETTIIITWATSLPDSDYITVKEDGVTKVASDETSPTDWAKSVVVGTHVVTLLFQSAGYTTITYSFNYPVYAVADFQVDVGSFQVSDDYVNTYVTSNYNGNYYVYEDNVQIDTSILSGAGTVVETSRDTTEGVTIAYAIKFVYEAIEVWFNTTYSNPVTPFHLTDYRVTDGATIIITWDSTIPSLDSLTIYEDGDLKVNADPESTTSWTKSTAVGNHYVTLIFSATDYTDIIHSFSYTVYPPIAFSIFVEIFYVSDDYLNMYLTSNYDYSYTVYENSTQIGTGNGMAIGTTIISPKNNAAGLYNFTVIFTYNSETIPFMTWYSNLIPPNHPLNDLWRMESQGFYNISVHSNLDFYWIDIYHDDSLIIDDSTASKFSIEKGLKVGWHNITLVYIYNCSTNAEGYPVTEYNVTLTYEFWYETTFFYDVKIRYIEDVIGLAISEINVNDFKTYIDGELIQHGDIDDVAEYSNYSYISNYDIRIKNTAPLHTLVINDLLGSVILSTTIDISTFVEKILILPVYRLGVINYDNETHKFGVQPLRDVNKPWHLSPEIPQGVFLQFWFCDVDYLFRIYSATEYTDKDGNKYTLWDTWVDLPPERLPKVFEIPLSYDGDITPPASWWENNKSWVISCAVIAGFLIAITILILVRKINKKELIK